MKTTRIISLIIVILMFASFTAACGNGDKKTEETTVAAAGEDVTTAGEAETTRLYPDFPQRDYEDTAFNILRYDSETIHQWVGIPNDIMVTETNGEVLNDSVYERNRTVEELFGVKIVAYTPAKAVSIDLQNDVMAGNATYDMVDQCLNEVARLFNLGLITDLDVLDLDFSMPWFDQNSVESFTISGKIFAAVSDVTYIDKLSTVVTFYNKKMAENIGITDMYTTALNGEWTLDKMLSYSTAVSADLNSDSKMDQNDSYCISCQNDGSYFFLHAAGLLVASNDGNEIKYTLNDERSITALEKIFSIMNDTSIYFNRQTYGVTTPDVSAMFANNQALFMLRPLQSLYDLKSVEAEFGIIPVPKFYADQEKYHVPINTYGATIICIPKGSADYEKTSLVFEALAAESYYRVMPSLYDVVLDVKLVDDTEASQVLDIVFDNRVYDLGMIWNFGSVRNSIVTSNMTAIASTLKRLEKLVNKGIENLNEEIAKLEAQS